jgi:hypothetical protein
MPGFFSANASLNDHSFASRDLIEVKGRTLLQNFGKAWASGKLPEMPSSAAGRADRQQCLRLRGNPLCFERLRCPDAFPRTLERRQVLFRALGGNAASRQQPVKFRMRQIEIARDLLELGAVHPAQPIPMSHARDDASHPAAKTAGE